MPESDCIMDFGLRVVAAESRVCDRYTDRDCGKSRQSGLFVPVASRQSGLFVPVAQPRVTWYVYARVYFPLQYLPARLPFYTQGSWESGDMDSDRGDLERR